MGSSLAWLMVAIMAGPTDAPSRCIGLSFQVDGRVLDDVTVELSFGGRTLTAQKCPLGFVVPPSAERQDRLRLWIEAEERRFDFGELTAAKVIEAAHLDLVIDTPPFLPGYWRVPRGVPEIRAIGFSDGTATFSYEQDEEPQGQPDILRDILLRVDLVDEGQWICLPTQGEWSADSRVALVARRTTVQGSLCCPRAGFVGVTSTSRLREVAAECLAEKPTADAEMLFAAMMRDYCAREGANRHRCKRPDGSAEEEQ